LSIVDEHLNRFTRSPLLSYGFCSTTSGAIQQGVPTKDFLLGRMTLSSIVIVIGDATMLPLLLFAISPLAECPFAPSFMEGLFRGTAFTPSKEEEEAEGRGTGTGARRT
jgi:hypothetical protein